jgi:hypothetical protein
MIGERTLDQYSQLITLVQAASGVLFIAGITVVLFGLIPSKKS